MEEKSQAVLEELIGEEGLEVVFTEEEVNTRATLKSTTDFGEVTFSGIGSAEAEAMNSLARVWRTHTRFLSRSSPLFAVGATNEGENIAALLHPAPPSETQDGMRFTHVLLELQEEYSEEKKEELHAIPVSSAEVKRIVARLVSLLLTEEAIVEDDMSLKEVRTYMKWLEKEAGIDPFTGERIYREVYSPLMWFIRKYIQKKEN